MPLVTQDGAQQLLSTIAGAIITATSIAFSMTIVALTLASSQFGPRLIRTFMVDRGTQMVLGILVSTFLFCILALHQLSAITENSGALSILSAASVVMAIIDVATIIYFIHHVSRSIQADEVIYRCFTDFKSDLDTLLPKPETQRDLRQIPDKLPKKTEFTYEIRSDTTGYVQNIDYQTLVETGVDRVDGIEVMVRSGDHVLPGALLMVIYGRCDLSPSLAKLLRQYVVIGRNRTPIQDPEFAIGQIVEVALRALSPGINDPFTAISCLDRLTSTCIIMSERQFPAPTVVNTTTDVWMHRRTFSYEGVINMAYNQIRQADSEHMSVVLHVLHCLKQLKQRIQQEYHYLLDEQADATDALARHHFVSNEDAATLKEAYTAFKKA